MKTTWLRNPRTVGTCAHCGGEARLTPGGWQCAAGQEPPVEPKRPPGHGTGLDGPACPERVQPQFPTCDGPVRTRMCVRCGRITARLDGDGVGWCGGDMPARVAASVRPLQAVR